MLAINSEPLCATYASFGCAGSHIKVSMDKNSMAEIRLSDNWVYVRYSMHVFEFRCIKSIQL